MIKKRFLQIAFLLMIPLFQFGLCRNKTLGPNASCAYTAQKAHMGITNVELRYNYLEIPATDIIYFNRYHNNQITVENAMRRLDDICSTESYSLGENSCGYIKGVLTSSDCQGSVTYTAASPTECLHNTLMNFPIFGFANSVKFEIKTVRNPDTGHRLIWGASVSGPIISEIVADGEVSYVGVATTKIESGYTGYRVYEIGSDGTLYYEAVSNSYRSNGQHFSSGGSFCEIDYDHDGIWKDGNHEQNIDWDSPAEECHY